MTKLSSCIFTFIPYFFNWNGQCWCNTVCPQFRLFRFHSMGFQNHGSEISCPTLVDPRRMSRMFRYEYGNRVLNLQLNQIWPSLTYSGWPKSDTFLWIKWNLKYVNFRSLTISGRLATVSITFFTIFFIIHIYSEFSGIADFSNVCGYFHGYTVYHIPFGRIIFFIDRIMS